jgi:hypothetical protein
MRRLAAFALLFAALPAPAFAQSFEGNWECLKGPDAGGILTIYGTSYGFASQTFGDPASGTGQVNGFVDGVQFFDGNLKGKAGIEAGRLVQVDNQTVMQLETQTEIVMVCTPRQQYNAAPANPGATAPNVPAPDGIVSPAAPPPGEVVSPVVPPPPPAQ